MEERKAVLPMNIRVEKARIELNYAVNSICMKYQLDGSIIDLIIESVLAQEHRQRLALVCNQIEDIPEPVEQKKETDEENVD